jgi:hypothetical protein
LLIAWDLPGAADIMLVRAFTSQVAMVASLSPPSPKMLSSIRHIIPQGWDLEITSMLKGLMAIEITIASKSPFPISKETLLPAPIPTNVRKSSTKSTPTFNKLFYNLITHEEPLISKCPKSSNVLSSTKSILPKALLPVPKLALKSIASLKHP